MNLFGWLKRKPKEEQFTELKESDNPLYTKVVYNSNDNFIILISYIPSVFSDVAAFIQGCSEAGICFRTAESAVEIRNEYEEDGDDWVKKPVTVCKKYYILISGSDADYNNLFDHVYVSNTVLVEVIKEIYTHRQKTAYKSAIKNMLLSNDLFNITQPKYDSYIIIKAKIKDSKDDVIEKCDDIEKIKSQIPESFTARDLLYICKRYMGLVNNPQTFINLIHNVNTYNSSTHKKYINTIYHEVFKQLLENPTYDAIVNLAGPIYNVNEDNDISIGDMDDNSVDEMFQQEYERFSAVSNNDVRYEDIDEEIKNENEQDSEEYAKPIGLDTDEDGTELVEL